MQNPLEHIKDANDDKRALAILQLGRVQHKNQNYQEALGHIAEALKDQAEVVRFHAIHTLLEMSDDQFDLSSIIKSISAALEDMSERVKKAASWVLYGQQLVGVNIEEAVKSLEKIEALQTEASHNAAMALCLYDNLHAGHKKALAFYQDENEKRQFAAAWSFVDYYTLSDNKAFFEERLAELKFGVKDAAKQDAIAGAIYWAHQQKRASNKPFNTIVDMVQSREEEMEKLPLLAIIARLKKKQDDEQAAS